MVLLVVVRVLSAEIVVWDVNIEIPGLVIGIDFLGQSSRHVFHQEWLEQDLSPLVISLLLSVVNVVPYPFPH